MCCLLMCFTGQKKKKDHLFSGFLGSDEICSTLRSFMLYIKANDLIRYVKQKKCIGIFFYFIRFLFVVAS